MKRSWPEQPAREHMAIKVLYLHHVEQISGAENSLRLFFRHLDRNRVLPLFAGPAAGPFPDCLNQEGIPVFPVRFGPLRDLPGLARSARRVMKLIREHRIDLLHANGPRTNICAGLAGRLAGIPAVWHMRNLLYGNMWDVDRLFSGLASRIICNSEAIRERFRGSKAWAKCVTILNAVDSQEFSPEIPREPFRREQGIAPGETAVGMVGRIGLGKGHAHFVEAAIQLLHAGAKAQFLIVGDTLFPEDAWRTERLRQRVKEAGVGDRVRFTGFRRDVPLVLRGLDVLVLASDAEPCGRVLFEAMASGTAIVATNSGGTPEIVRNGFDGLLVPPGDPQALGHAIGRLIDDPLLRTTLGRAGLARAREEFSIERHVARTLEVYAEALHRS